MTIIKKIDECLMDTKSLRTIFLGVTMIIVYLEFIEPSLTWSKWIITPSFIFMLIGFVWEGMRYALIEEKKGGKK